MICINLGYECRYIYIYISLASPVAHWATVCRRCRPSHRRRTRAAAGRRGAVDAVDVVGPSRRGIVFEGKRQHGILKVKMTHRRLYDTMIWHDSMRFNVSLCLPRRSLWLSALVPTVAKARHPKLRNRMWHTTSLQTCLECDVVTLLGSHSKCLVLLFALLTFATCNWQSF